jgi:hypothetical protein
VYKYVEPNEQMAYCRLRILTPGRDSSDVDDYRTDHPSFNVQISRAFGVISKQQLHHKPGTVCQVGTGCYSLRLDDTYSQIREAQSVGLVFIKSQTGSISLQTKIFSQQKEHTSTDLHVSNGGGPISMCYASLAAAAAEL